MEKEFKLETLIRKNILALKSYSSARDEFSSENKEMIFLDANENPFENGLNRYPDPQQRDLKSALAKLKKTNASQILLGNGSDEILDLIFRCFCEPKLDHVITLPPTYGMYKVLANLNDIEEKEVLLTPTFELDVEKILKTINEHTKIIFICSPNNPSGNSFLEENIFRILKEFKGLVVIDEAYIDFSSKGSWIKRLKEFPNLIVTQTFSKAYGMAGIRLGMCFASEEIIKTLNSIKPPYNINELTQQKALQRLQELNKVKKQIRSIISQRELLKNALAEIDFVNKVYASDANFLLLKVDDANLRYKQLLENNIVVRHRGFQPLCENTLRITVGTALENKRLIKTIRNL